MAARRRLLAQEQALATLSHEMRTPLNGILGMAGLLGGTRLDETQGAYLKALRESGEHLLSLVDDILDYAKLDAQGIELEPQPTDVERLLQGVCELLSPRAHAAGLEIAWAAQGGLPPVMADDGRLRQILFNLAGNAVKLTPAGGVLLTVEPRDPDDGGLVRLRFSVRDTGPGVSPEDARRIFGEFVQAEAGARAGGAGLGLAIVRRLADAFGGEVAVGAAEGGGACFTFEAAFAPAGPPAPDARLAGRTVGVVSASAIVREAARRQIEACGGVARAASDLASLAPSGCACVLVDAAGLDSAPPPGVPALVLLAPEERGRIEPARAAGYAGYLIKPLRRTSLAERVLAAQAGSAGRRRARPAPLAEDERVAPRATCGARVLLAEDNPVNALLARALLTHEGCVVERVADGEEALAALAGASFDLILMDMRMPKLDGAATARAARARGITAPIVALTANAFEEDRRACLEAGMSDFLAKPLDPARLRAVLARWVGREIAPTAEQASAA